KNIKLDDQLQYMQQFCNGTLGEFSSQAGILQDSFISFLMNELGRDTFLRQAVFDKNKSQLSESHSNWLAKSKVDYRSIGSLYARNRAVCFFEKLNPVAGAVIPEEKPKSKPKPRYWASRLGA
ncbi:MAG: hypothetical protein K0U12_07130, partial [Gammaproteobacteria bacterium]|nr:hypothetical protein [Gammaproteobacteria bacterium]